MDNKDYSKENIEVGKLKIFFGYAAGVGKTYAMLEAAQDQRKAGLDVVVGYIERHTRPDTLALLEGLEILPLREIDYKGIKLKEFDLDGALKRRPELIIVDELAHTNAQGSRHAKRYQDVEELLKAGIDVYTTINVQHLESLNDLVESFTNVFVSERIPDSVFDMADQVELVDIEPDDLIERLKAGKVYKKDQAQRALNNFFTKDNLAALREISLRRTADRLSKVAQEEDPSFKAAESILVCLSPSQTNKKVIRTAARMAETFHGPLTALFVQTPDFGEDKDLVEALGENIKLAEQLNARIVTLYGDDPAIQITEYAKLSGITKIIIGRTGLRKRPFFYKKPLADKLSDLTEDIEVYIIPDSRAVYQKKKKSSLRIEALNWLDLAKVLILLVGSTLLSYIFFKMGLREANIITVYILGVLLTAMWTDGYLYGILSSLLGVLTFNFFFTVPRFSFAAYASDYPVTFMIMLVASILTSYLATRVEKQAVKSADKAHSIEVLLTTNQKLQGAKTQEEILAVAARQLYALLNRPIYYSLAKNGQDLDFKAYPPTTNSKLSKEELGVAQWVLRNDKHAGATTNTLSNSDNLYLSVRGKQRVMGIIAISCKNYPPMEAFEKNLMISILDEAGTILERQVLKEENREIELKTQRETLRANLLRAISHDLRTPLTSISGNAAMLMEEDINLSSPKKKEMYSAIYDDSLWLINLTENLLSLTKMENGEMRLNKSPELIDEVFQEALDHIDRQAKDYKISYTVEDDFLIAQMDVRLIVQVIVNIINNAIKYTPKGSSIALRAYRDGDYLRVDISDNGPGISDEGKAHIFDMFYTIGKVSSDNRRGLGLGLSLCKMIVEAHGGQISVRDNQPRGAIFSFTLPVEEVHIDV